MNYNENDNVKFYFFTDKGIYVGQEVMSNFENSSSKWLGLFEESNIVLTELRKISGNTLRQQFGRHQSFCKSGRSAKDIYFRFAKVSEHSIFVSSISVDNGFKPH